MPTERSIQDQIENPPFTQESVSFRDHNDENQPLTNRVVVPLGSQRPSEGWLKNPAWIDGGVNPPRFYYSHEEMDEALLAAGVSPATRTDQQASRVSPTLSLAAPLPGPLSLDLVNFANGPDPNVNNAPAAHIVNVTLLYTPPPPPLVGRAKAAAPKKAKVTKMDNIVLTSITRTEFIKAFLTTHALEKAFSPGVHSGPDFKLWWTGASGGKGGAPSIQTDHQFSIALVAILKKKKDSTVVNVEFDVDMMDGFRITPVLLPGIEKPNTSVSEDELAYGTRVPQVENFTETAQLHGRFILELKKRWPCETHQGEHGELGHCYVAPSGEHTRLNTLRMKTWAAAIAAGDATKHEPPYVGAFDGARDGRISGSRARGRTGPHRHATPTSDGNADVVTMFMSALLPLIGGFHQGKKRAYDELSPPVVTPKRAKTTIATVQSPVPSAGLELHTCLQDFAKLEGIDLTAYESVLQVEDYSPDIIPFVEDAELRRITGATAGVIIKFKNFCKVWYTRYEAKRCARLIIE